MKYTQEPNDLKILLGKTIEDHLRDEVEYRTVHGDLSGIDKMISVYSVCKIMGAKIVEDVARLIEERKVPFCFMDGWMVECKGVHSFEASAIKKGYGEFKSLIDDIQAHIDLKRAAISADIYEEEPVIIFHPSAAAAQLRRRVYHKSEEQGRRK